MRDFFVKYSSAPAQTGAHPAKETDFSGLDSAKREHIVSLALQDSVPAEVARQMSPAEQRFFVQSRQLAQKYKNNSSAQNINNVIGEGPDGLPIYEKLNWQNLFARDPFVRKYAPNFSESTASYSGRVNIPNAMAGFLGGIAGAPFRFIEPYRQEFGRYGGPYGNAALYGSLLGGLGLLGASAVNSIAGREVLSAPAVGILSLLAGAGYGGYYGHNMRKYPPVPQQKKQGNFFDAKNELISEIRSASAAAKAKVQAIKDVYAMKKNEAEQLQAVVSTLGPAGAAAVAMHSLFGSGTPGKLLLNAAVSGFAGMAGRKLFGPAY